MIQFKDKGLEARLQSKAHDNLSPSQVACRDLWRYEWLLESEEPIMLTDPEKYALASTIKAMPHLLQPSQIKRVPLLIEDAWKSSRNSSTGSPSQESLWAGLSINELCRKLNKATPLQLFALLERLEKITHEEIDHALLSQRFKIQLRERILQELLKRRFTVEVLPPTDNAIISFARDNQKWSIRSGEKPEWLFWYYDGALADPGHPGKDMSNYLPNRLPQLAKELVDFFEKVYRHRLANPTSPWSQNSPE